MAALFLGASRADITPPLGCAFTGHLNRNQPAQGVLDPLFARILSLSDGATRVLIVNLDLLELGPPQALRLERAIRERAGLDPGCVLLAATHTHTGPPVIDLAGVPVDQAYFAAMEAAVCEAAGEAIRGEAPVSARVGAADVRLGVNRRRVENGRVLMAPNPDGPVDERLTVVAFDAAGGRTAAAPRALLLGYAMHPTTLAVSLFQISADYPGRLGRALRERLGAGVEYAFLQGASGDIKPALVDENGEFKEGDETDIEVLGRALAEAAVGALGTARPVAGQGIEAIEEPFSFFYDRLPSAEELEAEERLREREAREAPPAAGSPGVHIDPRAAARCMAEWARRTREQLARGGLERNVDGRLTFFRIGSDVACVGVPGELFAETGLDIRRASPFAHTMVAGYAGGSLGYFPTAQALREGGYEAAEAHRYYGRPAAFAPRTAEDLAARSGEVLRRLKRSAQGRRPR